MGTKRKLCQEFHSDTQIPLYQLWVEYYEDGQIVGAEVKFTIPWLDHWFWLDVRRRFANWVRQRTSA